jgi:hypothetical protein
MKRTSALDASTHAVSPEFTFENLQYKLVIIQYNNDFHHYCITAEINGQYIHPARKPTKNSDS